MKKLFTLSLATIACASAFAGGGDLYHTKGCHQEYNGYWGFGAGWNHDRNESRVEFFDSATGASVFKLTAKEGKSNAVGHLFLGYNFYNDMPYSVAVEAGMYTAGKETSKAGVTNAVGGNTRVGELKTEREPAYYLALKPRYNSGEWWMNLTLGVAATTYRVKASDYGVGTSTAQATRANLISTTRDGFTTYGWMLGAGVGMWFNPNWAVSLDYDYMHFSKESSNTFTGYTAGVRSSAYQSGVSDGTASHFVTLNLKNNFNWMA